uniref:Helicase sen1 n=4 Tax=Lygus hesperus TaxID=30085 RepID=A0A146LZK9_LYGHE
MASSATLSENLFLVSLAVGPSGRQEFELIPGENVIGRKRDASINLPHLDVSREHCIIFSTDGMLALFDQGSRNGTFVNGHKVTPRSSVSLFVNDTVGFGVTSSTIESYVDAKTPFLVYRVTKKIPNEVFERLTQGRHGSQEKTQCVKRRADSSSDVPALKRTKSEAPVPSPAFPVSERSKILQPFSPLSAVPESTTRECNASSAGNNVPSTRPDGMMEFFVIDDSSNESEPALPSIEPLPGCGTESSSSAVEISRVQNSFLTKSVDENSTLKNGSIQNSALESSTPGPSNSSTNSTLRSNDDQKSCGKDASSGSSSMQIDETTSSAKVGLFKTPLMDARLKKEKFESRYVEISSFRAENEDVASKSSDIPTFSLISDDEDSDDGMMSSQIFSKPDESQSFLQMPTGMDTSLIDDEIDDVYDSDEDSFFEHLSQTLSQSFVIPEEKEEKRKKSSSKSEKGKKNKDSSEKVSSKKITPSKTSKRSGSKETSSKTSKHVETTSKTITPDEKKSKSDEKSSTSKRETSKSKTKKDADDMKSRTKTRSQHKDPDDASKLPGSVEDHKTDRNLSTDFDDLQVKDIKKSRSVSVLSEDKVKERRVSVELKSDTNKISDGKSKAESKIPQVEVPKKKDVGKKTLLIEPQSLSSNSKESRKLKSAGSAEAPQDVNGVVALPKRKTRVTFKEQNMVEVREFQCLGNMKKLSTMPSHLLKEHPPKIPSLQWNGYLLRSCQQVSDICQWNLKWLQEFQRVESDPPLINYQPEPIGNRYKKFDDYYFTMLSLVMHELWSELCRIHLVQTETQRFNIFSGVIEHIEPSTDKKTQFSRCKIVTSSEGAPFLPNFGDIVGVQILAPNKERTHLYDSFGIVTRQYFKERLKPSREANFLLSTLPANGLDKDKMIICPIEVIFRASKTHSNVSRDCFVHLRVYKNVINQVKYFLALQKVFTSPLKSVILDPATSAKGTADEKRDIKLPSKQFQFPLNALQKEAVTGVTNSVIYEDYSISLIHGPPGTGKSTTITSIILHLLPILRKAHRKGPPPKILLCAPSNTAIDELCLKLLDIRRKLPEEDKFKLTRVGNEKMMHPLVHEISSSALARRGLMSTPDPETLETEIMLLRARIQGFRNGLVSSKAKPNEQQKYHDLIEKCETRLAFYGKTLANVKSGKAPCNPDENRKLLNQEESSIITGAEIIATTLSSCSSRKISDALSDSTQFSCCIVDEATQATEPEILIPLHHDICHLVLVGDPQQLGPTVISKFAKERNFEWSLYHRLMNEWKEYKVTPLYPLREQYRMHAEIVSFPSAKFYNAELKTPDFLQIALPFTSYHVISHVWPENANEESNDKEARFVVELVQKMCASEHFHKMTVGIIVPYQSQRALIANIMKDRRDRALDGVVVNTIDSFQGQEKDVIILSCVRTKRIGFLADRQRLNVALTRAKRCLLVVGNFKALKNDEVWAAMIADAKSRDRFVEANPNDRIAPSVIFSKLFAKQSNNRHKPPKR